MHLGRRSPSSAVREAAIYALWFLADKRAIPMLCHVVNDAAQPIKCRALAAEGLGLFPARKFSVKALTRARVAQEEGVREEAVRTLDLWDRIARMTQRH